MKNYDPDMPLLHAEDTTKQQHDEAKYVVIYHANCPDGWVSAVLACIALKDERTLFEPRTYEQAFDPDTLHLYAGKHVFILDFSLPKAALNMVANVSQFVTVMDHHKTFAEAMGRDPLKSFCLPIRCDGGMGSLSYEPSKCGAQMTYDWFSSIDIHKSFTEAVSLELVNYVGDRDLWKWEMPQSKEINEFFGSIPKLFAPWRRQMLEFQHEEAQFRQVEAGKALLSVKNQYIERLAESHFTATIAGYKGIPVCNTQNFQSEVGHRLIQLCPNAPFSAMYYDVNAEVRKWSLRGRSSDDFDCTTVAKLWGGGGHAKACGFKTSSENDPLRKVVVAE